jgi:hypothetical protein
MKRDGQKMYLSRLLIYSQEIQQKSELMYSRYLDDLENHNRFEAWKEYLPYLASGLEGLCTFMPVNIREVRSDLSSSALSILSHSYDMLICEWPPRYKLTKEVRLQVRACVRARTKFIKKLEHRAPGITL